LLVLHVRLDNRFGGQGRNWIPFLLPIFYVPLCYAPKAISSRLYAARAGGRARSSFS